MRLSAPLLGSLCAALLVLCAGRSLAAAQMQDGEARELWFVLVHGDEVWGRMHRIITPRRDGMVSITTEARSRTNFMGNRQENASRSTVVVAPDGAPHTFELRPSQAEGSPFVTGERTDDGFVVHVHQGDDISTSTYRFDDDLPLMADVSVESWLHHLPAETKAVRAHVLDSSSGAITETAIELIERGRVRRISRAPQVRAQRHGHGHADAALAAHGKSSACGPRHRGAFRR